jgi:MtN3 and saliva related transmembrane protein
MSSSKSVQWVGFFVSVIILGGSAELALAADEQSLLFPGFQRSEVVGIVAGFGTTFAAVPDLIGMFRRGSSKGMNPTMAGMMGAFQILWVYYGFLIGSRPVMIWNLIAVVINFLMVGAYFYFVSKEKMGQPEARSHR